MTPHPPCNVRRSTDTRRPLSESIKLLYHVTAVPFFGGKIRFAERQFMLRLISSICSFNFLETQKRNNRIVLCSLRPSPHFFGYFRICNLFFPDSKISPFTRNIFRQIEYACPHASDDIWIQSRETRAIPSEAILRLFFGNRLNTIFLRNRIRKYVNSPSTRNRIRLVFLFFSLWRAGSKVSEFAAEIAGTCRNPVDGSRIRKETVPVSKLSR